MATVELKREEALVLIDFLIRFRDEATLSTEHEAEQRILWDLCAMLQSQVPELVQPDYEKRLTEARDVVASDDCE
jgi:hypothetical protein